MDNLSSLQKELNKIHVELAVYNSHLQHYLERIEKIEEEIDPIKKHVNKVTNIFWFLTTILGVLGVLKSFIK